MDPSMMLTMPENLQEYNGDKLIWTAGWTMGVIIILPALRVYGRLCLVDGVRRMGLDDILMLLGVFFGLGYCIAMIYVYTHGGGHHFVAISMENVPKYMISVYAAGPMFMVAMGFVKLSMLALYWRLSRPNSIFRWSVIVMAVFIVLMTIGLALGITLPCNPVRKAFDPTVLEGSCIDMNPYYFAQSALMIATDIAVYLLPIRMIWKIQLPRRQKISLVAIFGFGGFAVLAGIIKLTFMPALLKSPDVPWTGTNPLVWSIVELGVSIFAACAPSLKIVVKRFAPALLGSSHANSQPTKGYSTGGDRSHGTHRSEYNNIHLRSLQGKKNVETTVTGKEMDTTNESMEQIIPQGNILRTTEVRMDIEAQSQTSERSL